MQFKTFNVVNLGCKVNRVEADALSAALIASGCVPASQENADLVVVNTCTVTGEADKKARKALRHALSVNERAQVVATGCAVAVDAQSYVEISPRIRVIQRMDLIASLAASPKCTPIRYGSNFRTRVNVKVQDGCDHACTYCIVHVARGRARSVPVDEVLREVREYLRCGAKEIVLTGIDLASYNADGARLADLCERLLEEADTARKPNEQAPRLRISSIEPQTIDERFINVLANSNGRICRHLHLPLQSGSSKVLRDMARPYSAREFLDLVAHLRNLMPMISLTTDIICGFPGETADDFEQTLSLSRQCRFSKIHVFPYSMRKGTPAAQRPDQIDPHTKNARAAQLRKLSDELRMDDLKSRRHTRELAIAEDDFALTESYHEVPIPKDIAQGQLFWATL